MERGRRRAYDEAAGNEIKEEIKKIRDRSSAKEKTNGPETKNGIITCSHYVNVRREPDPESDVVEILRKGDWVIIHESANEEFYKISTSVNKDVYITKKYVREGKRDE